uniref:eIF-4F 25 kDa subunit n=1 Tax=Panagrellus redivivus TaxID=6233 RepID=A0A7E4W2Z6_PANRE
MSNPPRTKKPRKPSPTSSSVHVEKETRVTFTDYHRRELDRAFAESSTLYGSRSLYISNRVGLTVSQVRAYFKRRRAQTQNRNELNALRTTPSSNYSLSRWQFWRSSANEPNGVVMVRTFDTWENFHSFYHTLTAPTALPWGSDYYLFREGIEPLWEDPSNIKGGRWLTIIERTKRAERLDVCWFELIMALIREEFVEVEDDICGAVVNVRQKGDKVALWTRDGTNDDINITIGHTMRKTFSHGKQKMISVWSRLHRVSEFSDRRLGTRN